MAKQLVGPIERHIEKAVVGIAGLILIAVIARYLVTSPNYIELGGDTMTASEIDAKVASKAAEVRSKIQSRRPELDTPERLYPRFLEQLDSFATNDIALQLSMAVPFGPLVPIIDTPEVIKGRKKLASVLVLLKPAITHGRSTFNLGVEQQALSVHNWVTVSGVFDRGKQTKLQEQQYGAKHDEIVFGPVELQRRVRRHDGSWSDEDWEFVEAWPAVEFPSVPVVPLVEEDGEIIVPHDSRNKVTNFYNALVLPLLQLEIIRPVMPEIHNGDAWSFPTLVSYADLLEMDDEYLDPEQADVEPEDRYRLHGEEEEPGEVVVQLTVRQNIDQSLDRAEQKLRSAQRNMSVDDATDAYNYGADVVLNRDANGADKAKAERLMRRAEQLIRDIKRRGGGKKPDFTGLEDEKKRELVPTQQIWAHDAQQGSVRSGETYQYRMRVLLFNALVGEPDQFEAKADAATALIADVWSEPSDPVNIEPDAYFFATGFDERKATVRFELFEWFDGVWVTNRWSFGVGQAVEGESREDVPIPGSDEIDRPMVPFAPGVTVMDIDTKRPYRDRKQKGDGITVGDALTSTCSIVLVDAAGELAERFVLSDKGNPQKKALAKKIFLPPKRR